VQLTHLTLYNFRNYARLDVDLPAGVILLQGANGQGKSNLLEAVYYLATTRSLYTNVDQQLLSWMVVDEEMPFVRLEGRIQRDDGRHKLEITLIQKPANNSGTSRLRKEIRMDGLKRRAIDYLGSLNVVLFRPEDIDLIAQGPSLRRRYLDITLSQVDPRYRSDLSRYNQTITQRNALLRQLQETGGDPDQLDFWDETLVTAGSYLILRRLQTITRLDELVASLHPSLTGGIERLRLVFVPRVDLDHVGTDSGATQLPLRFDPQFAQTFAPPSLELDEIVERFQHQLHERRALDLIRGVTSVGPHRDDLRFLVDGVDMTAYGSRGQQRTAALSLKLAEVAFMQEETGESPVLLLDDVMSELDEQRRACVTRVIREQEQVIVTTTDLADFPAGFPAAGALWHVQEGRISEMTRPENESTNWHE